MADVKNIKMPPGGPDGELAASMRYLHQRYSMPYNEVVGILTDVGTEELAHLEIGRASCRERVSLCV